LFVYRGTGQLKSSTWARA